MRSGRIGCIPMTSANREEEEMWKRQIYSSLGKYPFVARSGMAQGAPFRRAIVASGRDLTPANSWGSKWGARSLGRLCCSSAHVERPPSTRIDCLQPFACSVITAPVSIPILASLITILIGPIQDRVQQDVRPRFACVSFARSPNTDVSQ